MNEDVLKKLYNKFKLTMLLLNYNAANSCGIEVEVRIIFQGIILIKLSNFKPLLYLY